MSNRKTAVLMSTYNGEKYICEQIDSILEQIDVSVDLFIRDDGSSDNTVQILEDYCEKHSNIHIIKDTCKNLGAGMSFMNILYTVTGKYDYDFYSFADQDDIWKKNKLNNAIEMIEKRTEDKIFPLLYCSNQILFVGNKELELRHKSTPNLDLAGHITKNLLSGCTYVFNKCLAEQIVKYECPGKNIIDYRLHDAWIFLIALVCGEVIYDKNSYIDYRIHESNVVGVKKLSFIQKVKKVLSVDKKKAKYKNLRMITAQELLERYSDNMNDYDRSLLKKIADYQKSFTSKVQLIKEHVIYEKSGEGKIVFAAKVFLNYI